MTALAPPVSRETHPPMRQFRQKRGDATRERLIAAVIAYAMEGRYRAGARQLAQHADVHHSAVSRHFGHVSLLYRVVAREHWAAIFPSLPFAAAMLPLREGDARAAVWAILVGEPRDA